MMITNLFVIANVKQLRTGGSFRILLPFFRTSWGVGVLNSAILNSFHNRVEFGTILEGLCNGGGGGWTLQTSPFRRPLVWSLCVCRCIYSPFVDAAIALFWPVLSRSVCKVHVLKNNKRLRRNVDPWICAYFDPYLITLVKSTQQTNWQNFYN